jgi:hypothetical protein
VEPPRGAALALDAGDLAVGRRMSSATAGGAEGGYAGVGGLAGEARRPAVSGGDRQ